MIFLKFKKTLLLIKFIIWVRFSVLKLKILHPKYVDRLHK